MRTENAKFLDENRGIYTMLVDAGIVKQLDYPTREKLLSITREEFQPGYAGNLWCQPCVCDMIKYVFGQYDQWRAKNPEPVPQVEEIIVNEPPVVIKAATFPKHDKPVKKKGRGKK